MVYNSDLLVKNKIIYRKTLRGNLLKIVREHYLRDDLHCGLISCEVCPIKENNPKISLLSPFKSSYTYGPVIIFPNANVLINQIDVFESELFKNIIVLETVLDEVKRRNLSCFKRLVDLLTAEKRDFFAFSNEHHVEAYMDDCFLKESLTNRNIHAIQFALSWYLRHIKELTLPPEYSNEKTVKILLLVDGDDEEDYDFKEHKDVNGESIVKVVSIDKFIRSLSNEGVNAILDKLAFISSKKALSDDIYDANKKRVWFPEHLSKEVLERGIQERTYLQGTFLASRNNFLEGNVSVGQDENNEETIFIQGLSNMNRAIHSDIVAVEVLPEDEWSCPSNLLLESENDVESQIIEVDLKDKKSKGVSPSLRVKSGRIVGIIKCNWRSSYCGVFKESFDTAKTALHYASDQQGVFTFVPTDRRVPFIKIMTSQFAFLRNQRIVVRIDSWPRSSRYPKGHYVRKLGTVGDKEAENEVLLLENDIPHEAFPQNVLECLPKMPWTISENDMKERLDLRKSHIICSIDPPGCTDIDDALHCTVLPNGNYQVGVHIADVSHFIKANTAIDTEASNRATTVYLVDTRIDMVPELLSSNLCSLRPQEDRLAFSVIWEISPEVEVLDTKFFKTIICSKAAFTYNQAQERLSESFSSEDSDARLLTASIRNLNKIAKVLRKRRFDNGALQLASTEIRFSFDIESNSLTDIQKKEVKDTNHLVEEFMLLANVSVANVIYEHYPECSVLRCHPTPSLSNFDSLLKAASSMGINLDVSSGKQLAESLDKATIRNIPYFNTMLRIMTTRCMTQALYFNSGSKSYSDYHHFGLATPIYTHFTSPIRRYADIMVHRFLALVINQGEAYPNLFNKQKNQVLCNHLNYRNKNARDAARDSMKLHTLLYFAERNVVESAYVLTIRKNAIQLLVPKYALEVSIYLTKNLKNSKDNEENALGATQDDPMIEFDSENCVLNYVGGGKLKMFDRCSVFITIDKSQQQRRIQSYLVTPFIPGFSIPKPTNLLNDEETKCE